MPSILKRLVGALILLACFVLPVFAQTETLLVRVTSNAPQATLFADSVALGPVSQQVFVVPATTRELRLAVLQGANWSIEPVVYPIGQPVPESLSVALDVPFHYRIETVPYGVALLLKTGEGEEKVGETPFTIRTKKPLDEIILRKSGYISETIRPDTALWNRHSVVLKPVAPLEAAAPERAWRPASRHRGWIDYAALGLAATSAAMTVHYKFKADRRYDAYVEQGGEALKQEVRRYDTRAAVALGTMQVGVGVFALRLALR